MRSPATSGKVNGAGRNDAASNEKRQGGTYTSPEIIAKHFPAFAHLLTVYDGRARLGCVVDIEGRREAYAFDDQDRPLGLFATRKVAMAAVSARFEHGVANRPFSVGTEKVTAGSDRRAE